MTGNGRAAIKLPAAILWLSASGIAADIITAQYNDDRTLHNPNEVYLTTATVKAGSFGELWSRAVDGWIYTQPLYLEKVPVAGRGNLNLVYVATAQNTVYAFDADDAAAVAPVWSSNLGPPATASTPEPALGVSSTPAIVRSKNALYIVTCHPEGDARIFKLHALDLSTGAEKFGGPATIMPQIASTAPDAINGRLAFLGRRHVQRPGLAVSGSNVLVAFAGVRDTPPFHGWVVGYDLATLAQTVAWNATNAGNGGGFWQSARAPAIDGAGNIYFESGNGDLDGTNNFGESLIRLTPSLSPADWFAPDNWLTLNANDWDLGVTGPMLLPGRSLVVGGSKTGMLFVLRTNSLGHLQAGNGQAAQAFQLTPGCNGTSYDACAAIHTTAFWDHSSTPRMFVWPWRDKLKSYRFNGSTFDTAPVSTGSSNSAYPGGMIALSSYKSISATGIVWAVTADAESATYSSAGTLRAFSAGDLTNQLWNSEMNPVRDRLGDFSKFVSPTVANGKVFTPTFSNRLRVYGLLAGPLPGDVNADAALDCADVSVVRASLDIPASDARFDARGDANRDGAVNSKDLSFVSRRVAQRGPAPNPCPVPGPGK